MPHYKVKVHGIIILIINTMAAVLYALWAVGIFLASLLVVWLEVPRVIYVYYRQMKYLRGLPGWERHWLWGQLHHVNPNSYGETLTRLTRYIQENRPKITQVWFGPFVASVELHHPDVIAQILKEPKCSDVYRMLIPWLGEGLLIAGGAKWARNRRLLTPAFHFEILRPYVAVKNACLEVFLKKWSESARLNVPVEVFNDVSLLSLDIILQCAFSYCSDCQNSRRKHPYVGAIYELSELAIKRYLNPLLHLDSIYRLTPSGRRFRSACHLVHKHSESVIRERKKALGLDKGGKSKLSSSDVSNQSTEAIHQTIRKRRKYLDFLDVLLTTVDEEGNGLTDAEIRDEADTFMFEGHDTTTSGMSWTLYCLAKYPEHQERVREEVREVLAGREWVEYEDLKELKYTTWCIKEAMRLFPPVFFFFRQSTEDIELDGYLIPSGTQLCVFTYTLHHNPEVWENPEDFDPLRFHPSNTENRHPFAYMPFSAGQRNCIGQTFALNEEKLVIAGVIHRFSVSLVEDHKIEMSPDVVLHAKYDIKLNLTSLLI